MWKTKIDPTDQLFSLYIREKADWKCEYCHKDCSTNHRGIHTSHYWGRGRENTRYDPENSNAFCFHCHMRLGHGDGRDEYRAFKIKQLGEKGFKDLEIRAHQYKKKDRKLSYLYVKSLQQTLKKKGEQYGKSRN